MDDAKRPDAAAIRGGQLERDLNSILDDLQAVAKGAEWREGYGFRAGHGNDAARDDG